MAYDVFNYAEAGASAYETGVAPAFLDLHSQVDAWIASPPASRLSVIYIGYNDIRSFGDFTGPIADYAAEIDRLIAAGATAGGKYVILALVHDFGSIPAGETAWTTRTPIWNTAVAGLAASRANVVVVDVFTPIEDVLANPLDYGLFNVVGDAGSSRPGWLHSDGYHFGRQGQELIAAVFDYCLRYRWDLTVSGSDPTTLNEEVIDYLKFRAWPAWRVIRDLADVDGWLACFDPSNPETRTFRNSGGTDYVTTIEDGLGNWPDVVQGTAANQPAFAPGHFGLLDGMGFNGSSHGMRGASSVTPISQPNIILQLRELSTLDFPRFNISATGRTSNYEHHLYVESFSWGGFPGLFAGGGLVGGTRTTNPVVAAGIFNGSSSKIFRNGTQLGSTGNAGTRQLDGLSIGFNIVGADSQHWPGWIGPTLVRNDADETIMARMATALQALGLA